MHRFAKQTLATWLRGRSRVGVNFKGLQPVLPGLPLHPKSASPMFGVYDEYPICTMSTTNEIVGLACTEWKTRGIKSSKGHGIPLGKDIKQWNENCTKDKRLRMEWFFDVGVVDPVTSQLCYVFEIVHTNPMDDAKIEWLRANNIQWIEISALWIMNRVKSPFNLHPGITRSSVVFDGKQIESAALLEKAHENHIQTDDSEAQ